MKTNVFIMERSVVQNLYHPKQAVYRGLEDLNCEYFIPSLGPKMFSFIICNGNIR